MKTVPLLSLALCAALLGGCATGRQSDLDRIARASKLAAYVGTAAALLQHPEWRPGFILAVAELKALETAETVDLVTLISIVHRLPVRELSSPDATLAITGATLALQEVGGAMFDLGDFEKLRPIVTAIRQGVELGLGP